MAHLIRTVLTTFSVCMCLVAAAAVDAGECCQEVSEWPECLQACSHLTTLDCTLSYEKRAQYLKSYCLQVPEGVLTCLNNSNVSRPSPPPTPSPLAGCCNASTNDNCREKCIQVLQDGVLDDQALVHLTQPENCGPPLTVHSDPMWACFLSKESNAQQSKNITSECIVKSVPDYRTGDRARLQCCLQANNTACREACIQQYTNQSIGSTLEILANCRNKPTEGPMETCLRDTESTCKLGCTKEIHFCSEFQNRPLDLFRNCNPVASLHAKLLYTQWGDVEKIIHPLQGVPINVDVYGCHPDLWRLLACTLHIQPCHPKTHTTLICYEDCLKLMGDCMLSDNSLMATEVCNELSPPYLQDSCVSISSFLTPSTYKEPQVPSFVFPCDKNPCSSGLECAINHDCHHNHHTCTSYTCSSSCAISSNSHLTLKNTEIAHIGLPVTSKDCFGFASRIGSDGSTCGYGGSVTAAYCEEQEQERGCLYNSHHYAHREMFHPDQNNFCVCYYGRVTCTNEQLLSSINCPPDYRPVCTQSGRTIPNVCYAGYLGFQDGTWRNGDCNSLANCLSHTCQQENRCVPSQRICITGTNLTSDGPCSQYKCETPGTSCIGAVQQPVCDQSGKQHSTLCSLLQTNEKIDYMGYCREECMGQNRQEVCGVDGQTYASRCHSEAAGVAIDYIDNCHEVPDGTPTACSLDKCPEMPIFNKKKQCAGLIPPGACCPQCGAMLRVIMDQQLLRRATAAMKPNKISTSDIISRLRRLINIAECNLYGHVLLDGTAVVIVLPSITNTTTLMTLQACNMEAQILTTLINNRSPVIVSDPYLTHLVGAELQMADSHSTVPTSTTSTPAPTSNGSGCACASCFMLCVTLTITMLIRQFLTGNLLIDTKKRIY